MHFLFHYSAVVVNENRKQKSSVNVFSPKAARENLQIFLLLESYANKSYNNES